MAESSKPILVFCATPADGHVGPLTAIAKNLVNRGFEVIFITGDSFQSKIQGIGATFSPLLGKANFSIATVNSLFPGQDKAPPPSGPHRLVHALLYVFVKQIPEQHETVQAVLHEIKSTRPNRKIILLVDFSFAGTLPILYGAPGLRPDGTIFLGIAPLFLTALHIPPGGLGLSYDTSPAGLERNKVQYKYRNEELFSEVNSHVRAIFKQLGAQEEPDFILEMPVLKSDRYLQLCIPSLEYPHPNPPPALRFVGSLPTGHRDDGKEKPAWWDDVVNVAKKRIVGVSQGTANVTFSKLIIPTMEALANADDVLVVVALGRKGAALPEGTVIPANARVADYIPFDDLLPFTDVFVTNGGYGGYQHCASHGVPMIVAGMAADKPEVASRVEWAGIGLNLQTDEPTVQAIKGSVDTILGDDKYRRRAQELQKEMGEYDTFSLIEKNIKEVAEARTEI